MRDLAKHCRVALVQCQPLLFDKAATLAKILDLVRKAAQGGAELIVLPELIIPGYPYGLSFGYTVGRRNSEGRAEWLRYYENSILCPGAETAVLAEAAKTAGVYLSIGVSERDGVNATLYNSNLIFTPAGDLEPVHRKLKPTGTERCLWGEANRGYFPVTQTPWGPMGCLICWESYMPLARVALYEQGITLYLAANTNDNPEWQATIQHIAVEGHVYVFNVNQYFTRAAYPLDLAEAAQLASLPEVVCRGGSCVVDPYGHYLTQPLWDEEGIVYADLDLDKVPASRMEFDACGHYSRADVLHFTYENR